MNMIADKCLIDTNVPMTANKAFDPLSIPKDLIDCVSACVDAISQITNRGSLVLDAGDEIYSEYMEHLYLDSRPGMGNTFMKWVHDNRYGWPEANRVSITKKGESYAEFPQHDGLNNFDNSDRKFIAVSNAHPAKPPILQAVDSKWWGRKDALDDVGITVNFVCPDYAAAKFEKKS